MALTIDCSLRERDQTKKSWKSILKKKSSRSSSLEWLIMNKSVNCIEWQIFVSLNPSEPFGITFAEALLSECKIVCPTTGGQVEYLQGLDESVSFVNGESVADIAYGIEKLLSLGKYPGLSASEKESFTYKAVAQRICEFCEK